MGLIGVIVLVLSLVFLASKYPVMLRNLLPGWLAASQQKPANSELESRSELSKDSVAQPDLLPSIAEGESTPTAKPQDGVKDVPIFTLTGGEEQDNEESHVMAPSVPSFPAANSAQRALAMPPPAGPPSQSKPALMLPPSRPNLAPAASLSAPRRIPSSGPLPNRGPPAGSQQRVSNGLSPNATVKTPNTRGKVLLSPGHSPMDWAALTRKSNLAGVSTFQRVTPSQLKQMTGRKGNPAWSCWQGKVYNITPYLPFHPGGEAELMKAAGRDGTKLFIDVHPWVNWENMLGSCLVGVMVPEDFAKSALEDMD